MPGLTTRNNHSENMTAVGIVEKLENTKTSSNHEEGSWAVVTTVFVFLIVAPYLSLLRLRFLKDQPLNKQSIMNKLCRDCNKIGLLFMVLWATYVVVVQFMTNSNDSMLFLQLTKYMSYANEGLFFLGMLYAFLIGFLRLYTTTYQVLDPLEDWFDGYEDMAMLSIRLTMSTLVIFYIGIIFLTSATPIIYHRLANQDLEWDTVSWKSRLKIGFNFALGIICAALFTVDKILKHRKDSEAQKARNEPSRSLNNCSGKKQNDSESAQTTEMTEPEESGRRNEFSNYLSLVSLLYMGSGLLVLTLLLLVYLGAIIVNIWWGLTMLLLLQGVFLPIVFLVCNTPFRNYCWRQVKGDVNNGRRSIHCILSFFKKYNDRVAPLQ